MSSCHQLIADHLKSQFLLVQNSYLWAICTNSHICIFFLSIKLVSFHHTYHIVCGYDRPSGLAFVT